MNFIFYWQINTHLTILQGFTKLEERKNAIPSVITQNISDVIKNENGCKKYYQILNLL